MVISFFHHASQVFPIPSRGAAWFATHEAIAVALDALHHRALAAATRKIVQLLPGDARGREAKRGMNRN
jgi:hypothetical protein